MKITDHLGNEYDKLNDMLDAYGLNRTTFWARQKAGWELEKALTTPVKNNGSSRSRIPCMDHLGNEYPSIRNMCSYYGMDYRVFNRRIRLNWSVRDALITPVGKKNALVRKG